MIPYERDAVVLVASGPDWPALYEAQRAWIEKEWAAAGPEVHHIGSTSIPGIAAKPIVDILVLLRRFPLTAEEVEAAVSRDYEYRGEQEIPGRQYFSLKAQQGYHLHVFGQGHPEALPMLMFRDYLRAHPEAAAEYEALKLELAARYPRNRIAYTDGKEAFVRRINALAQDWAGLKRS